MPPALLLPELAPPALLLEVSPALASLPALSELAPPRSSGVHPAQKTALIPYRETHDIRMAASCRVRLASPLRP
jgi:hypothetical protein